MNQTWLIGKLFFFDLMLSIAQIDHIPQFNCNLPAFMQLCLFVYLSIDTSSDHKAEEKPPGDSYIETGSEVEKEDKPVPVASFNEGTLMLIFPLSNKHFSALG